MKRIGLITSKKWFRRVRGDLAVQEALRCIGFDAQILPWEEDIPWETFDLLILRSPWDYYANSEQFCLWLDSLEQRGVQLANGVQTIRSNIDKEQQLKLLHAGSVPVLPSKGCHTEREVRQACLILGPEIVLKPSVSAGGHNTFLFNKRQEESDEKLRKITKKILSEAPAVLVQPFVESIYKGECAVVFFKGEFSHAVLRFPGVLGEKKPPVPVTKMPNDWKTAAQAVCNHLGGDELLYCRIDLVEYQGKPYLMEVELAEPDLYLGLEYGNHANPLANFVRAIVMETERKRPTEEER